MISWAFLVLEEHPYGREMLQALISGGFVPSLVIQERSVVSEVEREKFLVRLDGYPIAPTIAEQLEGLDTRRAVVDNHNSPDCIALIEAEAPDLLVLGGTRILKPPVFASVPRGALNAHPGLLPEVRGSASVAWAIHLDLPVGCTCHFIEKGIDTGPIVGRREIPVHRGDTYEHLCHATVALSAVLMREALQGMRDGTLAPVPQPQGGEAHRNMPDEMVEAVKRKLADGTYLHFC